MTEDTSVYPILYITISWDISEREFKIANNTLSLVKLVF